jgi:hypothetical protein
VSGNAQKGFTITNTRTPGKTSLSVRKVWQDDNNCDGKRPSSVTVQLLANGEQVNGKTLELNEANGWSGTFTELDQKIDNVDVVYTVEEVGVGSDYLLVSNAGDAKVGYTLTNYHAPETIDILGAKHWDDSSDAARVRPATVTIRLYANGVEVSSQKVNETSNPDVWKWWFPNRPKYKDGKEIAYTVSEDAVPNYQTTYSVDGDGIYHITNRHGEDTNGKTQVTVHQVWADYDDQDKLRPQTRDVYLYENGVKQGTYDDPKGVVGFGTVRGREIYDPESGAWYWLDSVNSGAKAIGKEVWMPYIYQNEKKLTDEEKYAYSRQSDPGMQDLVYA